MLSVSTAAGCDFSHLTLQMWNLLPGLHFDAGCCTGIGSAFELSWSARVDTVLIGCPCLLSAFVLHSSTNHYFSFCSIFFPPKSTLKGSHQRLFI